MRPQPSADDPLSILASFSSAPLKQIMDQLFFPFFSPKECEGRLCTPERSASSHTDGGLITGVARHSSGKQGQIIAQAKSVKATPDAPSQLRCYWTGA